MDVAISFAKVAVSLKYEDIPPEIVAITKRVILDSLGISAAGSSAPGTKAVIELVKEWGGREDSTVIASGCRVPAINAALANGAMIRTLDYNETYDAGLTHPDVPVIPAAFAIAEMAGEISGREFLAAVTLAMDIHCRMALSSVVNTRGRWLPPQLHGFICAAIAAGRLLGLTEEQMISAIGLAYAQASGSWQNNAERVLARGLQGGFSSKGGVLAALMAKRGITGARNSLEGEQGLYNLYFQGDYDRQALVSDLGKKFDSIGSLSFKPYPSCRQNHPFIDAALQIVDKYDIRPEQVSAVVLYVGLLGKALCEPLEVCQNPTTINEAQFSIPYNVAVAIAKRSVALDDFLGNSFRDPDVLKIAQKTTVKFAPDMVRKGIEPGRVEIEMGGGQQTYSQQVDFPKGDPLKPLTREEHIAKFRDCIGWAARTIPAENVDCVIDMIDNLERIDDAGQVMRLLAGE